MKITKLPFAFAMALVIFEALTVCAQIAPVPVTPLPVIIDADAGNDVSIDAGIYAAARLQQLGYIDMLAVTSSSASGLDAIPHSAAYIQTYLYWANLRLVPVGAFIGSFPTGAQYTDHNYCEYVMGQTTLQNCGRDMPQQVAIVPFINSSDYPDAVTVLRKALAGAANNSVVMIEMGVSQNFDNLLNSPADSISPLTGSALIAAKVQYLIQMGGKNPTSTPSCCTPQGAEWNFQHAPAAAADISTNWPTVIYYSGFEIGDPGPQLGAGIYTSLPSTNPLYIANQIYDNSTSVRFGWDVSALFFAVQGTTNGYFSLSGNGTNTINNTTGANTFSTGSPSTPARYYLIQARSDSDFQAVLNPLLTADIRVESTTTVLGNVALGGITSVK